MPLFAFTLGTPKTAGRHEKHNLDPYLILNSTTTAIDFIQHMFQNMYMYVCVFSKTLLANHIHLHDVSIWRKVSGK